MTDTTVEILHTENCACGVCCRIFGEGTCAQHYCFDWIEELANRIESEHMLIPKDAQGDPLKLGQTYYGADGRAWQIISFKPGRNYDVVGACGGRVNSHLKGKWLSKQKPDTQADIDRDAMYTLRSYCAKVLGWSQEKILQTKLMTMAEVCHLDLIRRQRELDARTMGCDA